MNFFSFSSLLIFASSFIMGIILILSTYRPKENIVWAFFCFFVSIWGLGSCLGATNSLEKSFFWWKIAFIGSVFSPILFYHFIIEYLKLKKGPLFFFTYLAGFVFLYLDFFYNNYFKLSLIFNQFYYPDWFKNESITYLIFYVYSYWILVLISFTLLLKAFSTSTSIRRNQMKYFILGISIGWIGAETDFLINFGIPFYPFLNILIALYPIILGYAMVRHQLMDINIIIKKSLIYSILITSITLIYFLSIYLIEHTFEEMFGYKSILVSLLLATIIALLFNPLKQIIQDFVEKSLFKGSYIQVLEQNDQLRQEIIQTEKLKAIAALASSLVHEIRNPLTAINTFTEYIPQKINDPTFLKQFAQTVPSEINRINALMEELLAFAKPSEPKFQQLDPNIVIQNVINLLSPRITKAHIRAHIDLTNNYIRIQADPSQLKQALLNIIMNAIDAMPNGGTLNISTSVITSEAKQSFTIEISDTGWGIAPEDLKHIFDPFFTKKEKGTGLGLAITQGIIEKHGGTITVKSMMKRGTTFRINFNA